MGHKNKKSLVCQVSETLKSKLAIGESKHNDKINGIDSKKKYTLTGLIMRTCNSVYSLLNGVKSPTNAKLSMNAGNMQMSIYN